VRPTGTGKTLIAEAAAFEALHTGSDLLHTPLIALTEQKFKEMQDAAESWGFSRDQVGLVTGNRRVNPEAKCWLCSRMPSRKVGWSIKRSNTHAALGRLSPKSRVLGLNGRSFDACALRQYGILEGSGDAMRISDDAVSYYVLDDAPKRQEAI